MTTCSTLPDIFADPESCWPQWLDACRVDDDASAAAYEAAPPAQRAALKTGLALMAQYFGRPTAQQSGGWRDPFSGFWQEEHRCPAPWAVVAFSPAYAAAARLTAACLPALLAQIPLLGAVCVGPQGQTPTPQALLALELTGVEDVFCLDEAALCRLLEETQPGPGRLVLLHKGELDIAAQTARHLHIPCYEERYAPALALPQPDLFDMEALVLAHGEGCVKRARTAALPESPAAIYTTPEAARAHCHLSADRPFGRGAAPLALTPGCEGFWLHDGLTPDFFSLRRAAFGLL